MGSLYGSLSGRSSGERYREMMLGSQSRRILENDVRFDSKKWTRWTYTVRNQDVGQHEGYHLLAACLGLRQKLLYTKRLGLGNG